MTPESIQRRAETFALMFRDGAKYAYERPDSKRKSHYTFHTKHVCDVYMPTGRIVACDPTDGLLFDHSPFTRKVRLGTYPVSVSLEGPVSRPTVVSAKIEFDPTTPTKWEMALRPKQNINRLKHEEFFGFGVDAGLASIGDARTYEISRERHDQDEIWPSLLDHSNKFQDWRVPSSDKYNIAMFESGSGDGQYPAFFGTTPRGRILCLLIDFLTIQWDY